MKKKFYPFLFFLLLAVIFILPLGQRELFSPDEDRYAEVAREMLESGDFITPRLNGILYFEKPVLGYWLIAASQKVFGENAFSARLPSMLGALICALVAFLLAGQCKPENVWFPYFAAGLVMCTPFLFLLGGLAVLDSAFAAFLTVGMYCFYLAVCNREKLWTSRTVFFQFSSGLFFGLAFLVKGFLAMALPGCAIVIYMLLPGNTADLKSRVWYLRRLKEFFTLPWFPLAGFLLTVLPWSVAIHRAQPVFWHYFFFEEHIKRFMEKQQHPEPFWFFVPILFVGLAYLVPLLWPAFCGLRKEHPPAVRYLLCWTWVPFLFLSVSSGKLPTYILPCFPPLILLMALGLYRETVEDGKTGFLKTLLRILGSLLIVAAAGAVLWHLFLPEKLLLFRKWELMTMIRFFWLFVLMGTAFLLAARKKVPPLRCWAVAAAGLIPFLMCWQGLLPEMVIQRKSPQPLLRRMIARFGRDVELYCDNYPFQGVCWAYRRCDVQMLLREGELEKGIKFSKAFKRLVFEKDFLARIRDPKRKKTILAIMPTNCAHDYLNDWLPKPVASFSENPNDRRTYTVLQY